MTSMGVHLSCMLSTSFLRQPQITCLELEVRRLATQPDAGSQLAHALCDFPCVFTA